MIVRRFQTWWQHCSHQLSVDKELKQLTYHSCR